MKKTKKDLLFSPFIARMTNRDHHRMSGLVILQIYEHNYATVLRASDTKENFTELIYHTKCGLIRDRLHDGVCSKQKAMKKIKKDQKQKIKRKREIFCSAQS
jgi:hypothetical protein